MTPLKILRMEGFEKMNVTLYSTGCPRCTIIEKKLRTEGIDFTLVSGEDAKQEMLKMGLLWRLCL